ncbi:phosphoesterase [Dictyoglomus thermophilum]|uniref:Phosphoesterase n=1 Tax=Dictyoglomus thermophilum TaxID=14 RepID=A0A7V3ZJV0_DICTH|nr:CehA/McbA family metallohydrolase [Dictyoglomus thermophilum]TYT24094.1 phosphoesterase [Dictyoglomus thermophilum]
MSREFHYNIELYPEDSKKLIPLELEVPEGIKEIVIKANLDPEFLSHEESKKLIREAIKNYISQGFEPLDIKQISAEILDKIIREFSPLRNIVNLRVIDADGDFRGTGDQRFTKGIPIKIGTYESTLGCVSGEIKPGIWQLILEIKQILKKCVLNIVVYLNREEMTKVKDVILPYTPVIREPYDKSGWVKGDIHLHSYHSDGELSIEELIKFSIKRGLDFIFLTDHNKISGFHTIEWEFYPIYGGIEFTTFWGHFLGLGLKEYIPWDLVNPSLGIRRLSEMVRSQGGIFCVAHPYTISSPVCPGCRCEIYLDYNFVDAMEIWTGSFERRRFEITESLKRWREILKNGFRVTALGSSDMHKIEDIKEDVPVNYLYVEDLSEESILKAIKEGRAYVTSGPEIEFYINDYSIGDSVNFDEDLILKYACGKESELRVIYNGDEYIKIPNTKKGAFHLKVKDPGYIYLEFWEGKRLIAFTNPIYLI